MDRKSCTKSNFCTENKKTNSPFYEAAKLLVFTVATSGRRCGIMLIIPRIEHFTSGWRPPRPRPEYLKVPNRNVVAVVVVVVVEGKQWKYGGGGGGGGEGGKTIEMWWQWWWCWRRKTIEFYGLKTYINAQHSNLFSVYILLLRSWHELALFCLRKIL